MHNVISDYNGRIDDSFYRFTVARIQIIFFFSDIITAIIISRHSNIINDIIMILGWKDAGSINSAVTSYCRCIIVYKGL